MRVAAATKTRVIPNEVRDLPKVIDYATCARATLTSIVRSFAPFRMTSQFSRAMYSKPFAKMARCDSLDFLRLVPAFHTPPVRRQRHLLPAQDRQCNRLPQLHSDCARSRLQCFPRQRADAGRCEAVQCRPCAEIRRAS